MKRTDREPPDFTDDTALGATKKRALRIMGRRNMSAADMEKRLLDKGEPPDLVRETVDWLISMGAINDPEYAVLIVRHYCAKGYGPARVRDELFKRGIPRELWDSVLENLDAEESADAAYDFLVKRLKGSTDRDDIRRASDALVRRGFGFDDARAAVNRYLESLN